MLSSNGTQATIQYFLNLIKAQSPEIAPTIFMTDRDQAQVNSIRAVFPECRRVFYCWWHVLRAIRTHFNTKEFPKLWELIQDWVRTTDQNEFDACWKYIEGDTVLYIGSQERGRIHRSGLAPVQGYVVRDVAPESDDLSERRH